MTKPSSRAIIQREALALLIAVQFLTRLPVKNNTTISEVDIGRSLAWYPAVGLIVAVAVYSLVLLLPPQLPAFLSASLALTLWVALSGALHLDGFADCVDAWVGGQGDREKTLEIMKDPSSGPMAVVAMLLLLANKLACLSYIIATQSEYYILAIPVIARGMIVLSFLTTPYVQQSGLGTPLANNLPEIASKIGLLICLTGLWLILPTASFIMLLITAAAIFLTWRRAVVSRLQGFTGDCVGALVELQETGLLVMAALFIAAGLN